MYRSIVKTIDKTSNFISYIPYRTAKTDIPIKWTRPAAVPNYNPKRSGDLKGLKEIDLKRFPALYEKSTELQTADDVVKRLFTLEFHSNPDIIQAIKNDYVQKVNRHEHDFTSHEAKIASMTASIRHLQIILEKFTTTKAPRILRIHAKELVEKRTKYLKLLRMIDYKRFEWLLDKLDIVYKPKPENEIKVFRKDSMRKLTEIYCDKLRQEKIDKLKELLESQQEEFLLKKLETLRSIQEKEKEVGVVFVTNEEIENVNKQLQDIKSKKKEVEVD